MNAPRTTDQGTPVAGFAQGGLVNDDINRMLQNQRNAVMRESQSRRMLNTLGAPPVKKFSDGGPAGSSSGVRRLKMSGYQEGGEVQLSTDPCSDAEGYVIQSGSIKDGYANQALPDEIFLRKNVEDPALVLSHEANHILARRTTRLPHCCKPEV
jgi:hypothetical protein